ncbi:MAG: hypothetical protein VKJ64_14560 [Leptolyngbyaceae bacterium]|nr:hypothetical protein [Leptolyngbyaceae bacterium]
MTFYIVNDGVFNNGAIAPSTQFLSLTKDSKQIPGKNPSTLA